MPPVVATLLWAFVLAGTLQLPVQPPTTGGVKQLFFINNSMFAYIVGCPLTYSRLHSMGRPGGLKRAHSPATGEVPMSGAHDRVPIDRSVLAAIAQGNTATERRLLRTFREANRADAVRLILACEQRNTEAVVRAVHRILGASRMAGATGVCDACEAVARAGQAGDWPALAASQRALEQELERVNAYVDHQLARPQ